MTKRLDHLILAAVLMLGTATTANANLLVNGGFETGDLTGWSVGGRAAEVFGADSFGALAVRDGQYGVLLDTSTTPPGNNSNVFKQQPLPGPGTFEFGGWIRAIFVSQTGNPSGNFDQVQLSLFVSANDPDISLVGGGSVASFTNFVQVPNFSPTIWASDWVLVSQAFVYSGPAGGTAQLNFNVQNIFNDAISAAAGDSFFLREAAIPEPASLALLALGGLGLLGAARVRRRA